MDKWVDLPNMPNQPRNSKKYFSIQYNYLTAPGKEQG
jgi:hypothetical protein